MSPTLDDVISFHHCDSLSTKPFPLSLYVMICTEDTLRWTQTLERALYTTHVSHAYHDDRHEEAEFCGVFVQGKLPMLHFDIAYQGLRDDDHFAWCLLNFFLTLLPVKARSVLKPLYGLMAIISAELLWPLHQMRRELWERNQDSGNRNVLENM